MAYGLGEDDELERVAGTSILLASSCTCRLVHLTCVVYVPQGISENKHWITYVLCSLCMFTHVPQVPQWEEVVL